MVPGDRSRIVMDGPHAVPIRFHVAFMSGNQHLRRWSVTPCPGPRCRAPTRHARHGPALLTEVTMSHRDRMRAQRARSIRDRQRHPRDPSPRHDGWETAEQDPATVLDRTLLALLPLRVFLGVTFV